MRVLIIEDNDFFRSAVEQFIGALPGLEVAGSARCGSEGLAAFQRLQPDLVLVDLIMAPTNGLETLRQIRAMSATVKVVMMSLHGMPDLPERVRNLGANGFVHKSRFFEELPVLVNQFRAQGTA
jgi:DNA-binding NarL/FixJ family response regulator